MKSQLIGKDWCKKQIIGKAPDVGKDWGQEEEWAIVDEMVEWQPRLNGHEFEQTSGDSEEQGSLVCCSPWGHKELAITERLNNNHLLGIYSWVKMNTIMVDPYDYFKPNLASTGFWWQSLQVTKEKDKLGLIKK